MNPMESYFAQWLSPHKKMFSKLLCSCGLHFLFHACRWLHSSKLDDFSRFSLKIHKYDKYAQQWLLWRRHFYRRSANFELHGDWQMWEKMEAQYFYNARCRCCHCRHPCFLNTCFVIQWNALQNAQDSGSLMVCTGGGSDARSIVGLLFMMTLELS